MTKTLRIAIPIALISVSVAWAEADMSTGGASGPHMAVAVGSVAVTDSVSAVVEPRGADALMADASNTSPLLEWNDAEGHLLSVSLDGLGPTSNLRIHTPLVVVGESFYEAIDDQSDSEAVMVSSIPEPASLAMLATGLCLLYPRRRKKAADKD